jgi:hypothetical protein
MVGSELLARSLDGGTRSWSFPDGGPIAVSSSGCFVDVLVWYTEQSQRAYRLSLP